MSYEAFLNTWTATGSFEAFALPKINYWSFFEGKPRKGYRSFTFRSEKAWFMVEIEWSGGNPTFVKYSDSKTNRKDYCGVVDVENVNIRSTPTSVKEVHPHHRNACKLLKLFAEEKLKNLEFEL